jgi:predicted HTH transcriptional regulator
VKQAISRWGRNPTDQTDSATVYLQTNAVQRSFLLDDNSPGVDIHSDKESNVIEFARDQDETTTKEVWKNTNASRKYVTEVLNELVERGFATLREKEPYGTHVYTVSSDTPSDHFVDLG